MNFNVTVSQESNIFNIAIGPYDPLVEYALYVFGVENGVKKRIKTFWYTSSNRFLFVLGNQNEKICFQYFIKHRDTKEITSGITETFVKSREVVNIQKLNFGSSFDLDVIVNWKIPVKYQVKNKSNKHFIFFNGAQSSNYKKYPNFHRISWAEKLNVNSLNIYDVSLNLEQDYLLAWYIGTLDNPLKNSIIDIIEKLKEDKCLKNSDLVFYGSSGGGWMALKMAEFFDNSLAVAINPQINILEYNNKSAIENFLRISLGNLSIDLLKEKHENLISINPEIFKKKKSKFILVQNIQDTHHYKVHFLPFWKNFSNKMSSGWDDNNKNFSIIYDPESGHAGETIEVLNDIVKAIELFND